MKFIFKLFFNLYLKMPFLGKLWRSITTNNFTFPVYVEGLRLQVLKGHWASIFLETYEPQTLQVFKNLLSEKKTIIDIGANVGLFSVHALASGANVIAFEPHPKICKILESNVVKRGAKVYPYALSDETSEVKLFLSDEPGSHSLLLETDDYVKVRAVTLDSIITSKIDLIKIDVEGAEVKVLTGMKELIKAHKPDLIIEVEEEHLQRFDHTSSSIFSFLEPYGYTYQQIGKENNYLFLVKEKNYLFQQIGVLSNKIWVEWIGLWGSGKTTCINNLSHSLKSDGYRVNTCHAFFSRKRSLKILYLFRLTPNRLMLLLRFLTIYIPIYIRSKYNKNIVITGELRSFFSCFIARLSLVNIEDIDISLWEGEFHLLPILDLKERTMEKLIDILMEVNQYRAKVFVLLKADIETVKFRILKDQKEGVNIRFTQDQNDKFFDFLHKFKDNQNYLVNMLKKRGEIVFESDGNLENQKKFINELYEGNVELLSRSK